MSVNINLVSRGAKAAGKVSATCSLEIMHRNTSAF